MERREGDKTRKERRDTGGGRMGEKEWKKCGAEEEEGDEGI